MRHLLAAYLVVSLTASMAATSEAQTLAASRQADAAAIRAHIESIFQAFVDKDRQKLAETHGTGWQLARAEK